MSKNCVIRTIEIMLQAIAVISGVIAAIEMFKNYEYKKKLKEKAEVYLDEELGELQDLKRRVSVLSPETEENDKKIKQLLCVMVASLMTFCVVRLFTKED